VTVFHTVVRNCHPNEQLSKKYASDVNLLNCDNDIMINGLKCSEQHEISFFSSYLLNISEIVVRYRFFFKSVKMPGEPILSVAHTHTQRESD
jgi:hypothetical protein